MSKEDMKFNWQQTPRKTEWGANMVEAVGEIDEDHTFYLFCEQDQVPKVEAMFRQSIPLTDEQMWQIWNSQGDDAMEQQSAIAFARAIEAAHGIKDEK